MGSPLRRALAVAAAIVVVSGALGAPGAAAHVRVVSTHPSGVAETSLRTAWIEFSGPIRKGKLVVRTKAGKKVSKGSGGRDPRNVDRVLAPLKSDLKPGRYRAVATIVAADGHEQRFSFGFRLKR
jgi:methionine-rich copper-binding protein CopC